MSVFFAYSERRAPLSHSPQRGRGAKLRVIFSRVGCKSAAKRGKFYIFILPPLTRAIIWNLLHFCTLPRVKALWILHPAPGCGLLMRGLLALEHGASEVTGYGEK